ncbi:O-antigen ligase family protein [Maribacter sp. IgM3_T14_3]|uniref:O-antigen ligase family protein n=1 Tax=Maribacter sp. IgM3_T14_3 TaxID=3415140 RepID=UPI003C6FD308
MENKLENGFYGFKFILENEKPFDASLLYTYDNVFSSDYVIKNTSSANDTLFFYLPSSNKVLKKFRLDFGNNTNIDKLKIKELQLLFQNDTIVIESDKLIQKIFNTSASVDLDKENKIIRFKKNVVPFDPYIIFSQLVEFTIVKKEYTLFLLLPFVILLLVYFILVTSKKPSISVIEILCLLFVICIPLKIAWTTFATILLGIYGLYDLLFNKSKSQYIPLTLLYVGCFCIFLLFGRPSNFSDIDMQMGLLLWALIYATVHIPVEKVYKYYVIMIMVINAMIISSGIGFLSWFNELYGLDLIDYFNNIKLYSRDVRGWLYYDHAAFLTFFGIAGVLFVQKLYKQRVESLLLVCVYHLILISFILITATRVGLFIYLFVLLNVLITSNFRIRLLLNTVILGVFSTSLFYLINKIDKSRSVLWEVTWSLIEEKPYFGYGIGQSNNMLQIAYHNKIGIGSSLLELNHSHNQYLTYLLEFGIVGSLLLLFILVLFLYKTKQYKNDMLMVFLFALSFLFLTESAFQTSKPLYVISFLFLMICSGNYFNKVDTRTQ